jgi:bifunctional non-homologous end joining protein LigD
VATKERTAMKVGRHSFEVTSLDKVMFPDDGITKGEVIDYYLGVADAMMPEVTGRLLTMERFPDGIDGQRFFQKSISDYFPEWIARETVPKKGGTVTHVVAEHKATLAYLAQQGTITMHAGMARRDALDRPDQLNFDLDPSVDDFNAVRRAALDVRDLLEEVGLFSVVKTTGSRGLHIVVPLDRSATFEEVGGFAHRFAAVMIAEYPDDLTIESRKNNRGDRIYFDFGRNAPAATAVAPYTLRARPGAPVAMPIEWSEVEDRRLSPQRYKLKDALRAVERGENPWKGWRRRARSLTEPSRRLARLEP